MLFINYLGKRLIIIPIYNTVRFTGHVGRKVSEGLRKAR